MESQKTHQKLNSGARLINVTKGNGTSMISLIVPPKDQISRIAKMLADEYGTASNIKSRVNRLSVLSILLFILGLPFTKNSAIT
jgi:peptide chain release factor subunit 1